MMSEALNIFFYLALAALNQKIYITGLPKAVTTPSPECYRKCLTCPQTPICPPGVSLVIDNCGCCKMCARQIGETCSENVKCDPSRNLYCTYNDVDEGEQTCAVMPGRSCDLEDDSYENGKSFDLGCKVTCTCTDGTIGCYPRSCPTTSSVMPPKDCLHPKLIKRAGKCCEEWICSATKLNNTTTSNKRKKVFENQKRLKFPVSIFPQNHHSEAAVMRRPVFEINIRNKCNIQTTQWSPCSTTCGWGVSERVITDKLCKLQKQTRLCQLRPCSTTANTLSTPKKKGKRCTRTIKSARRVSYTFSGCNSKPYTPRYCGSCNDGRCCSPKNTVTKAVKFTCDDGYQFKKRMMIIKSCRCHQKCSRSANDIFIPFRRFDRDYLRD